MFIDLQANVNLEFYEYVKFQILLHWIVHEVFNTWIKGSYFRLLDSSHFRRLWYSKDYDTLYKLSDFQCLKVFASNLNYCYTKVYAQELRWELVKKFQLNKLNKTKFFSCPNWEKTHALGHKY
jgi:uncharacterized iron-regulated protein